MISDLMQSLRVVALERGLTGPHEELLPSQVPDEHPAAWWLLPPGGRPLAGIRVWRDPITAEPGYGYVIAEVWHRGARLSQVSHSARTSSVALLLAAAVEAATGDLDALIDATASVLSVVHSL